MKLFYRRFNRSLFIVLVGSFAFWIQLQSAAAGGPDPGSAIPTMKEAVEISLKNHPESPTQDITYKVKKNFLLWLAKKEQLSISDEVRGHFDKAVTKAEEKMDSGEGEVTQSAITKLKLGLAGTENDITRFNADIKIARLHLSRLLKRDLPEGIEPPENKLPALSFTPTTLEEFLSDGRKRIKLSPDQELELAEQLIEVNKARIQMKLAKKNRKITRALLVTEVANYDFGIGNEGDLFEALIIYTRVLVGYYDSIYNFNMTVLDIEKQYADYSS